MKKILGNTALVLFGIVVAWVILDLVVWLVPIDLLPSPLRHLVQKMESRTPRYWRADPYLRSVIRPRTDVAFVGEEFSFRIKTNLNFPDAGFRGGTLGGQVWGIAVGDSFTFGCCVDQEETWVAKLAKSANHEIENLGMPGFGPTQYARTLEKYGLPLKPKVVLYGLYTNDLADSVIFEKWLNGHEKRTSFSRFMKRYSAVYNLFRSLRSPRDTNLRYVNARGTGVKLNRKKLRTLYTVGPNGFDSAWALAARNIERAIEQSKRIDATFVLLYFPSKEEVYWDLVADKEKLFPSFEGQRNKFSNAIREFCSSREILCLDLTPGLKKRALLRQDLYFPTDIHWNEQGNRAAADEIYRFLLAKNIS